MPPSIDSWQHALVTAVENKEFPKSQRWGFFIPMPSVLAGCQTAHRRANYFMTWLRLRLPLYHVYHSSALKTSTLTAQCWRDALANSISIVEHKPTNARARQNLVQDTLASVFKASDIVDSRSIPCQFHNEIFHSLDNVPYSLQQEILWEMYEMGFFFELHALDRVVLGGNLEGQTMAFAEAAETTRCELISRIFKDDGGTIRVRGNPNYAEVVGLGARQIAARAASLEALRQVLIRWPGVPSSLARPLSLTYIDIADHDLQNAEITMARFYVQTFVNVAGRHPLVPHICPDV